MSENCLNGCLTIFFSLIYQGIIMTEALIVLLNISNEKINPNFLIILIILSLIKVILFTFNFLYHICTCYRKKKTYLFNICVANIIIAVPQFLFVFPSVAPHLYYLMMTLLFTSTIVGIIRITCEKNYLNRKRNQSDVEVTINGDAALYKPDGYVPPSADQS